MQIKRIARLSTSTELRAYLDSFGISLPLDEVLQKSPESPMAQPYSIRDRVIGNRLAVLPMEGWDGNADGSPGELTVRRWQRFGRSGAKLVFGGEAVAVRPDCRANPRGLILNNETLKGIAGLRTSLLKVHKEHFGKTSDLMVGLQLTHAGRFTCPSEWNKPEPKILYHHPLLDRKFGIDSTLPVMSDDEIEQVIADFISVAVLSQKAGFDFVDIKHCHGYLGHEFLSAVDRPGRYGGSFENRTRFLREIVTGIRTEAPGLAIGMRFSAFDFVPFQAGENGEGEPMPFNGDSYAYGFGGDGSGTGIDLSEPVKFLDTLIKLGIQLVCITASSAYYTYHVIRPCSIPAKGSYTPPEDPLVGVARLIEVTSELKRLRPQLTYVGSGYSYLQEWLPNVAQQVIRGGKADFIGVGRMVLSYPEIISDVLAGKPLQRKKICRTCSSCTTAPRHKLVSGCYLTDSFYKNRPEYRELKRITQSP